MKKTIAILLVAILAVSSVFAAFSGKASVGFGGNLDNGNFGFIDQSTNAKIDLELATANAENVTHPSRLLSSSDFTMVRRALLPTSPIARMENGFLSMLQSTRRRSVVRTGM